MRRLLPMSMVALCCCVTTQQFGPGEMTRTHVAGKEIKIVRRNVTEVYDGPAEVWSSGGQLHVQRDLSPAVLPRALERGELVEVTSASPERTAGLVVTSVAGVVLLSALSVLLVSEMTRPISWSGICSTCGHSPLGY